MRESPKDRSAIELRELSVDDVDAVLKIQMQCYGDQLIESDQVFVRRLQTDGHCSLAAVHDGEMLAYLAAYWSLPGLITPFNGDFGDYHDPSVLYLHDMAVSPTASGRGLGHSMVEMLRSVAGKRGVRHSALVSVQGSRSFWEAQGYRVFPVRNAVARAHLSSYGPEAVYMVAAI